MLNADVVTVESVANIIEALCNALEVLQAIESHLYRFEHLIAMFFDYLYRVTAHNILAIQFFLYYLRAAKFSIYRFKLPMIDQNSKI